jgi:hypothetical protein
LRSILHPLYSREHALCDFDLFGKVKQSFRLSDFPDAESIQDTIEEFCHLIPLDELAKTFQR